MILAMELPFRVGGRGGPGQAGGGGGVALCDAPAAGAGGATESQRETRAAARQIRYQGCRASQCGQATVVETGARNTQPQPHV